MSTAEIKLTKDEIQKIALKRAIEHNFHGTFVMSTGTGKTKFAIDCIKSNEDFKKILITSPRTNLKENWIAELRKWGILPVSENDMISSNKENHYYMEVPMGTTDVIVSNINSTTYKLWRLVEIDIVNIQTCYKWNDSKVGSYDLIIADEIHTIVTPEYSMLLVRAIHNKPSIPVLGLTATPDDKKEDKDFLYEKYCPIIFEYLDSAKDNLINKREYIILTYELSDNDTVIVGTKHKKWQVGEKSHYEYLTEQIRRGQKLMSATGSTDWFKDAADWFWSGNGDPIQKNAARIYLNAIKMRKEFLWQLSSSAKIAEEVKRNILSENDENKVLLFSELTSQANKLSAYTVHSNNSEDANTETINLFNRGDIKEMSSVRSLTLGMNLTGANYAIMESYNGSSVDFMQKSGRTDRLDVNDVAKIIFILPKNTQAEEWFKKSVSKVDKDDIKVLSINRSLLKTLII